MGDEITGIICKVWPQCHHPEICQDKCFDDDIKREHNYITPNPCQKIFRHKWLDPNCVEKGCQSLALGAHKEKSMSTTVHIMRGVSGSGKSTRAKELTRGKPNTMICSADDFFMKNGHYEFDQRMLSQAHAWCRGKFQAALEMGLEIIVVDNTNTQHWEYKDYVDLATAYGCTVEVERVGELDETSLRTYANRNKHGVPLEVLRKQAKRFEK
jgi:predicted kinase